MLQTTQPTRLPDGARLPGQRKGSTRSNVGQSKRLDTLVASIRQSEISGAYFAPS